jgi:hypothetical protein
MNETQRWKGIKLEFKNVTLMVATDGNVIRVRYPGMKPIEEELTQAGVGANFNTIRVDEDVYFCDVPESNAIGEIFKGMFTFTPKQGVNNGQNK